MRPILLSFALALVACGNRVEVRVIEYDIDAGTVPASPAEFETFAAACSEVCTGATRIDLDTADGLVGCDCWCRPDGPEFAFHLSEDVGARIAMREQWRKACGW